MHLSCTSLNEYTKDGNIGVLRQGLSPTDGVCKVVSYFYFPSIYMWRRCGCQHWKCLLSVYL